MLLSDPRTNFLFWNIKNKPLVQNIVRLAESHDVHVLMFAETAFRLEPDHLVGVLNAGPRPPGSKPFSVVQADPSSKLQVFSRLEHPRWTRLITHEYYDVWSFSTDAEHLLYLAAVHFPPISVDQGDGQRRTAMELRVDLEQLGSGDSNTLDSHIIVCGDFNANPFDPGVTSVYGLNASLSREVVQRSGGIRTLGKRPYAYLYNPMWRLLGGQIPISPDGSSSAVIYGTYYNSGLKKSVDFYWYTLDQVLINLSLFDHFRDGELRVLTRDAEQGGVMLVSRDGIPNQRDYSDHLPLLFSVHR